MTGNLYDHRTYFDSNMEFINFIQNNDPEYRFSHVPNPNNYYLVINGNSFKYEIGKSLINGNLYLWLPTFHLFIKPENARVFDMTYLKKI